MTETRQSKQNQKQTEIQQCWSGRFLRILIPARGRERPTPMAMNMTILFKTLEAKKQEMKIPTVKSCAQ